MRCIVHIRVPDFLVRAARRHRPGLEGVPLAIVAAGEGQWQVQAADRRAWAAGVRAGQSPARAHQLCPRLRFWPYHRRAVADLSLRLRARLAPHARGLELAGPGLIYLERSGAQPRPEALLPPLLQRLAAVGLPAVAGVGPNRLLAETAASGATPGGWRQLTPADAAAALWPLPVGRLWGGPKTAARLIELGVETVGDLAAREQAELVALFGRAQGLHLWEAARGLDDSPVAGSR